MAEQSLIKYFLENAKKNKILTMVFSLFLLMQLCGIAFLIFVHTTGIGLYGSLETYGLAFSFLGLMGNVFIGIVIAGFFKGKEYVIFYSGISFLILLLFLGLAKLAGF